MLSAGSSSGSASGEILTSGAGGRRDAGSLAPVSERIALLDVLRGVAVLGILLINIGAFSGYVLVAPKTAAAMPAASADAALRFLETALIEGKFYSLFSLLFGVGFAVMVSRAERAGRDPIPLLARRYAVLLAIGTLHVLLIWWGDILQLYALLGFVLLGFTNRSVRALVTAAVVLLALPIALYGLGLALLPPNWGTSIWNPRELMPLVSAIKSGTYAQIVAGQVHVAGMMWFRRVVLMFIPRVLGMFVLGFALGRLRVFEDPARHARLFRALLWLGILVGLPASVLFAGLESSGAAVGFLPLSFREFVREVPDTIGTPLLSLGYVAGITLLFQRAGGRRLLGWFAPVGRMALSNYLLHSVMFGAVFCGIGLGWFMRTSVATSIAIAVCGYALQIAGSRIWLSRFQFGPVEWVWRQLTYGKRVPLRRSAATAIAPGASASAGA
jgi:uncharacterized protein